MEETTSIEDFTLVYDYTPLINMADLSWPIYFPAIRASNTNISYPYPCRDYILEEFGYAVIFDSPIPDGDVITEVTPVQGADGKFYRTYVVRDFDEEEAAADLAQRKQGQAANLYNIFIQDGFTGITVAYAGTNYTLQMTADGVALLNIIKAAATSGSATDTYLVNLKEGVSAPLNKSDALGLIDAAMKQWGVVVQNYLTVLKATYEATSKQNLPAVPNTFIS